LGGGRLSISSLEQAIAPGARILLDSTALIAHLKGDEAASPLATHVIDQLVESGRNEAIISMVSAMEVIVRPLSKGPEKFDHAKDFLRFHRNFQLKPIDFDVAVDAATFRVNYGMATPDALIIATGQTHQVAHLIANDKRWKTKLSGIAARMNVIYLGDYI
jgi:predicted nucleic acid-binding protein